MIKHFEKTLKGDYRIKNDDRVGFFENEGAYLAVLCDGMGGHSYGDVAASMLVSSLGLQFQNIAGGYKFQDAIQTKKWIGIAIETAKKELKKQVDQDPSKMQMGTTLVAAIIIPKLRRFFVFNSGDSRAYAFTHKNELIQITKDQNVGNSMIDRGLDFVQAFSNEKARYLTSSIGPMMSTTVEIYDFDEKSYSNVKRLLLTSDGVHEFLYHSELEYLTSLSGTPEFIGTKILEKATINQSNDNMSVIVVDFEFGGSNND
ncbi:PP2C family protein-serine/threonine phosphatase [Mycoplasmopsis gallopavonis]|uniref:Serine/threonine phosphatase stp n=1 Tax=Mycoplasmopsis gallopavonis TaxID=76629 RepID=A0A449B0C8_9BACT|nr:protein phosphatase 2C domain-containing protein [Mycoplasmopsis gallopavonis]RIV16461.1 serine/threonine-protein phosphatase [Mycoplasmopsis gallopavonis]VEU73196.1 Serine/threonine phosphatase stp [Mycoplasmopsis gallopavonis]